MLLLTVALLDVAPCAYTAAAAAAAAAAAVAVDVRTAMIGGGLKWQ